MIAEMYPPIGPESPMPSDPTMPEPGVDPTDVPGPDVGPMPPESDPNMDSHEAFRSSAR